MLRFGKSYVFLNRLIINFKNLIMLNKKTPLFIGLHGYAGSGKDTVGKILRTILSHNFSTFEEFSEYYTEHCGYAERGSFDFATIGENVLYNNVLCVAFTDQLKEICHSMFGIPLQKFYYNKETGYLCINGNFEYTQNLGETEKIDTTEDFSKTKYTTRVWMSLREILVYVGTNLLQNYVNKSTFVNTLNNKVYSTISNNQNVGTIIISDVRFPHEIDYIENQCGITIDIIRPNVSQMSNIGEHSLDKYKDKYTFTIMNDGIYKDLLFKVWELVHENIEFFNNVIETNQHTQMRLIKINNDKSNVYRLLNNSISSYEITNEGYIYIDLNSGERISISDVINRNKLIIDIKYNIKNGYYEITTTSN